MSKIVEENKAKILLVLNMAKGAAPIGYISKYSGIKDHYELLQQLEQLEKESLIHRPSDSLCCPSFMPLFELTSKAKNLIQQVISPRLQDLVNNRNI